MNENLWRSDIQSMRGVAVLMVIFHHLGFLGFEYGFLGVDIFFVISGYVISGYVVNEVISQRWTLTEFYRRRLWRLMPALFAVLAFFLIGVLVSPASYQQEILRAFPWVLSGLGNVFYFFNTDYFANENILNPLLHAWSLGVEEQFYLVFIPLIALAASLRLSYFKYISSAFILVAVILLVFWFFFDVNEQAWFYLLPSRIYQFVVGILAFEYVRRFGFLTNCPKRSTIYGLLAVFATIVAVAVFGPAPEPSLASVYATVLTGFLLLLSREIGGKYFSKSSTAQWVGQLSYSLYLVHWPIISFSYINGFDNQSLYVQGGLLVLTLFAAVALHYLVERYFYFARPKDQLLSIKWLGVSALALLFAFLAITAMTGVEERGQPVDAGIPAIDIPVPSSGQSSTSTIDNGHSRRLSSDIQLEKQFRATDYSQFFKENYKSRFKYGLLGQCFLSHSRGHQFDKDHCFSISNDKPNLFIFGDSHAAYFSKGVRTVFSEFKVSQSMVVGCLPVVGHEKDKTCTDHIERSRKFASENDLELVIVYANWDRNRLDLAALRQTLAELRAPNRKVVLLSGSPSYRKHLARVLYDADSLSVARENADALRPYLTVRQLDSDLEEVANATGATFISIPDLLCEIPNNCRIVTREAIPIFYDYGHMTEQGAVYIATQLREALGL